MALEPSELRELREALRATVGERTMELLMSHLPSEEIVTKPYLDEALGRFATKDDLTELRLEFVQFRGDVLVEMRDLMREQTRTFTLVMAGTMIALVGAMFAGLAGL